MRLLHSALALATVLPTSALAFSDVGPSYVYADAIAYVQTEGIVSGYADGTFKPSAPVSRVEFLKMLMGAAMPDGALTLCDPNHIYSFPDANKTAWYAPYLCSAVQHNVVNGYPDGTFKPTNQVTFAEAAKMMSLSSQIYPGIYVPEIVPIQTFAPAPWYEYTSRPVADAKLVPVSVTRLDQPLTRGEVAEMLYRWLSGFEPETYQRYERLSSGGTMTAVFSDAQLGVSFEYDAMWGQPLVTWTEQGDSWRLDLGPVCDGCAEGSDTSRYQLFGISTAKAEIQLGQIRESMSQGMATVIRDTTRRDGLRLIEFTEGGMCGYRSVLLIGETRAVKVTGFCLGDAAGAWNELEPLIDSLKITNDVKTELAFDGCGTPSDYMDARWYNDFMAKVDALPELQAFEWYDWDVRGAEGFIPEMCASLDGTTVLAIWNGGYCSGTGLVRYDIKANKLTEAIERGELAREDCYSISEFGKRQGSVVPLSGGWGDAGCSSTFNYEYDLEENVLRLVSSCGSCQDEPVECQYYE